MLVPKSLTLNDDPRRNGRYFALSHRNGDILANYVTIRHVVENTVCDKNKNVAT